MTRYDRARSFALLSFALLAGCAGLATRPLPPKVEVEGVRVMVDQGGETRLRVRLDVANPNAYEIAIRRIEASLRIEDRLVALATLPEPVLLPASGNAKVEVEARPDFAALRDVLDRILRRLRAGYEVSGFAVVQEGMRLDFRKRGELPIADLLGRMR
jgi:LEA14-like dessication related protein